MTGGFRRQRGGDRHGRLEVWRSVADEAFLLLFYRSVFYGSRCSVGAQRSEKQIHFFPSNIRLRRSRFRVTAPDFRTVDRRISSGHFLPRTKARACSAVRKKLHFTKKNYRLQPSARDVCPWITVRGTLNARRRLKSDARTRSANRFRTARARETTENI